MFRFMRILKIQYLTSNWKISTTFRPWIGRDRGKALIKGVGLLDWSIYQDFTEVKKIRMNQIQESI